MSVITKGEMVGGRAAWERQSGEPEVAFAAFLVFRDLGMGRTIVGTSRRLAKSRQICDRWAQRWGWRERAEAWDAAIDRDRRAGLVADQRAAVESHAQASRLLLDQAMRILQVQQRDEPEPRAVQQAALALDKAIHHNRLALGLPTDFSRNEAEWKRQIEQSLALNEEVRAIIAEQLCPNCRERVYVALRRAAVRQRQIQDELL